MSGVRWGSKAAGCARTPSAVACSSCCGRQQCRRSFTKTDAASFINSDNVDWRASLKKWPVP